MSVKYYKGVFHPQNPDKYIGKREIIWRSGWEYRFMKYLDTNDKIKQWCSECVTIPYSLYGKTHRYFPDFLVIPQNDKRIIVEIKPSKELKPPRKTKNKKRSTLLYEQSMYEKNQSKWKAAQKFCAIRGWEFKVITEKSLIL